ncbi:MAG: alpha/beta hydrolase [Flavobacteriales bacterium]
MRVLRYFQGYPTETVNAMMRGILLVFMLYVSSSFHAQVKSSPGVIDSNVVVATRQGQLHGSLMQPVQGDRDIACLIIAGSGPTDRNGNGPTINTDAYVKLATHLAENGITSLRFDKRGIGESRQALLAEDSMRFEDGVGDAREMIQWLRMRPGIKSVVVIGHSEGSLIGMIASLGLADAFVSIAGPGRSADVILKEQLSQQTPPEYFIEANRVIDEMKAGKHPADVPLWLMSLARPSVQNYIISWFKYDPAVEINKLQIPIGVIQGGRDLQVGKEDGWLLTAAARAATFSFIDNMNHVLVDVEDLDSQNRASYGEPERPLSSGLITAIDDFFNALH